jgi:hypothetical protein
MKVTAAPTPAGLTPPPPAASDRPVSGSAARPEPFLEKAIAKTGSDAAGAPSTSGQSGQSQAEMDGAARREARHSGESEQEKAGAARRAAREGADAAGAAGAAGAAEAAEAAGGDPSSGASAGAAAPVSSGVPAADAGTGSASAMSKAAGSPASALPTSPVNGASDGGASSFTFAGDGRHTDLGGGTYRMDVATTDRPPGFWNMPRSEMAFGENKTPAGQMRTFSAGFNIHSGNSVHIAQLFSAEAQRPGGGGMKVGVLYKEGQLWALGKPIAQVSHNQPFQLDMRSDGNSYQIFVDGKLADSGTTNYAGTGGNYFRAGAYLSGGKDRQGPYDHAVVDVSNPQVG